MRVDVPKGGAVLPRKGIFQPRVGTLFGTLTDPAHTEEPTISKLRLKVVSLTLASPVNPLPCRFQSHVGAGVAPVQHPMEILFEVLINLTLPCCRATSGSPTGNPTTSSRASADTVVSSRGNIPLCPTVPVPDINWPVRFTEVHHVVLQHLRVAAVVLVVKIHQRLSLVP